MPVGITNAITQEVAGFVFLDGLASIAYQGRLSVSQETTRMDTITAMEMERKFACKAGLGLKQIALKVWLCNALRR